MTLSAITDFEEAVDEILILLNYSKRTTKNPKKYSTLNKAAIILLCSKFESFIESFFEEYSYEHLKSSTNRNLNTHVYDRIVSELLEEIIIHRNNNERRREIISRIIVFCGEETSDIESYNSKPKFSYGKHGQNEIEKLLRQFGFYTLVESQEAIEFFQSFNSLNHIRNNIIHEDATPSLTHQDVEKYLARIRQFINNLNEVSLTMLAVSH